MIMDRDTNQPKGFAFIEMNTQAEAEKAISMFNGKELDSRAIKVNIAARAKSALAAIAVIAVVIKPPA